MGSPNLGNFPWLGGDPSLTFPKNWTLLINGIPCGIYQAEDNGIVESNSETGRSATVVFQIYWFQRIQFIAALLGTSNYVLGVLEPNSIVRTPPAIYPVSALDQDTTRYAATIYGRMICTSITSIRGTHWWTDTTGLYLSTPPIPGWGAYVYALVTAEFTTPLYNIAEPGPFSPGLDDLFGQPYCISKIKSGGEVFAPPTGSFVFAGGMAMGHALLDVGAAHMRTRHEISCTRVRMPIYPVNAITMAIG